MLQIKLEDYRKIHRDFRSVWPDGRRSAFAGSLGMPGHGTRLCTEGIDFEIIKPERKAARKISR